MSVNAVAGLSRSDRSAYWAAVLASLTPIVLVLYAGYVLFTPTLFWDMLEGYLKVAKAYANGDHSIWWAQHNEHRILLSRLLFWVDLHVFSGSLVFLAVLNYVLVGCAWVLVFLALRERAAAYPATRLIFVMYALFLGSWVFSWMQNENLLWAFQSQFFLAQSLPLAALLALYKAHDSGSRVWFIGACILGLASSATMANGILALPLMAALALLTGMRPVRIISLFGLAALALWLYFSGYSSVPGHGSLSAALRDDPVSLLLYVLVYLGNPVGRLAANQPGIAAMAGAVLALSAGAWALWALRRRKVAVLELALLFFLLYVAGTAVGTGGGRLIFGVEQAMASRYATPALLAWGVWFVLIFPIFSRMPPRAARNTVVVASVLLCLLTVPRVVRDIGPGGRDDAYRWSAMLALELGIADEDITKHVITSAGAGLSMTRHAVEHNASVFGREPVRDVRDVIGRVQRPQETASSQCSGHIEAVEAIPGNDAYRRVRGWAFDADDRARIQKWYVYDAQHRTVGVVLNGHRRADVRRIVGKAARRAGFLGYVTADAINNGQLNVGNASTGCRLTLALP